MAEGWLDSPLLLQQHAKMIALVWMTVQRSAGRLQK